jgi:CDP-glycerol glycerophosphotransferase (TagB/SpsB family)
LPAKTLLIGGRPYMDNLIARAAKLNVKTDGKTILIASTWDKRGILKTYGKDFVEQIAKAGYNVIVRPHPYSYIFELDFINQIQNDLSAYKNVKFDNDIDNLMSLAKSDIMISDITFIRFDYYLTFGRPIITLDTNYENYSQEYEYSDLDDYWAVEISEKIGMYLKKDEVCNIVERISSIMTNKICKTEIDKNEIIVNIGNSAEIIAEQIINIVNNKI